MTTITQNNVVRCRVLAFDIEQNILSIKHRNNLLSGYCDSTGSSQEVVQVVHNPARMNSVPRNTGLICKGDEPAAETTGDLIRLVEEDSFLPGPEDLCRRLSFQLPDIKQKEDYSNCFANGD